MDINEKLIELENRVKALELYNKRVRRNKIIAYIVTFVIIVCLSMFYIYFISKIFNTYTVF